MHLQIYMTTGKTSPFSILNRGMKSKTKETILKIIKEEISKFPHPWHQQK